MKILVVGAGATGGYFGARLAQAGRDVTFLVRPRRAEQLRAGGLRIVSPTGGDVTLQPRLVTADALNRPFDVILLGVKAFALEGAIADFAPAVGPGSLILPMLNGMKHMDRLIERFGEAAVIGGVCRVATTLDEQGRIVQLNAGQGLGYGECDGSRTDRVTALNETFTDAGFDARLSDNIMREMWEKWIMLAAIGAANCLMRGDLGQIHAAPGGPEIVQGLIDEVVAIVRAAGVPPGEAYMTNTVKVLRNPAGRATTSLYRDLQQGHAVEADSIIGDLLARGRVAGVAAPLLAATYANLCVYQTALAEPPSIKPA